MKIRRSIPLFFILGTLFVGLTLAFGPFGSSATPTQTNNEAIWTIKIDDTAYDSRNFDINQQITSFDKESVTVVDPEGFDLEIELCPAIPSVEMSNTVDANANRDPDLTLKYDVSDCTFSIIEKSATPTSQTKRKSSGNVIRADSGQLINGWALAELKAADVIEFGLTQTKTRMLVDADTLFKHSYSNDCDTDSPAGLLWNWSITWLNDACRSTPFTNATNYVMGNTEGDYNAEFRGGVTVTGDPEHTSSARLKITTTNATVTCIWDPADVEDFVVNIDPWGPPGPYDLGVTLRCHNGTV